MTSQSLSEYGSTVAVNYETTDTSKEGGNEGPDHQGFDLKKRRRE